MVYLVFAVIAAALAYFMFIRKGPAKPPSPAEKSAQHVPSGNRASHPADVRNNIEYLNAQWAAAKEEKQSSAASTFPTWFFDPATERQRERLKNEGTLASGRPLTKGAASDLIGLREPLDDEHAEILKFFKVPLQGLNQTIGRYEVKRLLSSPENVAAWTARPIEPMQKEYMKFFSLPVLASLGAVQAEQEIQAHRKKTSKDDERKHAEWQSFQDMVNELDDREARADYGIKKPPLSAIALAMGELRAKGEDADDVLAVVDQLIKMRPNLARDI